jgi:solute carrier family 13 (sodium-dependent dicarboxylate transporter), member 2/3/5
MTSPPGADPGAPSGPPRRPDSPSWPTPRRVGFLAGLVLFALLLVLPPPPDLDPVGWRTAAVALLMAVWWMTESLPIPATSLLPLALFPLLGILDMPSAAGPYANPLIFLFLGGFLLAIGMERWGLHRRIALGIMARVGTGPRSLVLGFMLASAFLSMWISNTATAAMMLPIGLAVVALLRPPTLAPAPEGRFDFGIALMLGIAWGASIGGVATLIGTPPNAILAGAADELLGRRIGFLEWMQVGVPVAALMLPAAWLLLVGVLHPPGTLMGDPGRVIEAERRALGPSSRGERTVAVIFVLTAAAWVLRDEKDLGAVTIPGIESFFPLVGDATIAILGALLLFLVPVNWRRGEFALRWEDTARLPWGVLILFGGGLSLARAMESSGLAAWIGSGVTGLGAVPALVLVAAVATLFIFLTELTSNTATATMAMPILAGAGLALGVDPVLLMATAALSASMAFMLPVATPPNAIVFASDEVTIPRMARAGLVMNFISIGLVSLVGSWLVMRFLVG